jgi:hypothetical protein
MLNMNIGMTYGKLPEPSGTRFRDLRVDLKFQSNWRAWYGDGTGETAAPTSWKCLIWNKRSKLSLKYSNNSPERRSCDSQFSRDPDGSKPCIKKLRKLIFIVFGGCKAGWERILCKCDGQTSRLPLWSVALRLGDSACWHKRNVTTISILFGQFLIKFNWMFQAGGWITERRWPIMEV